MLPLNKIFIKFKFLLNLDAGKFKTELLENWFYQLVFLSATKSRNDLLTVILLCAIKFNEDKVFPTEKAAQKQRDIVSGKMRGQQIAIAICTHGSSGMLIGNPTPKLKEITSAVLL